MFVVFINIVMTSLFHKYGKIAKRRFVTALAALAVLTSNSVHSLLICSWQKDGGFYLRGARTLSVCFLCCDWLNPLLSDITALC